MNIAVIGLSHKTATVEVREKLSISELQMQAAIAQIKACPHIDEVAILSTCNRLEIYCVASETDLGLREVMQFLAEHSQIPLNDLRRHLFILLHEDAVMRLMRVAGGLDSLVLGEGQILSQVKQAHKLGQQYQGIDRILNRLFKQAITAGKRVRTETEIGTGAVSISSAAVELAQLKVQEHAAWAERDGHQANTAVLTKSLEDHRVTIVGAGKMARLLVQHLVSKGVKEITILNRSRPRADELVRQFSGNGTTVTALLMEDLLPALQRSDIVFTSTSATAPIIDRALLMSVLTPQQALMLIDISVPRNVHADVETLGQVKSFNVDDLKEVVAQNYESRRQMAQQAEVLLEEEAEAFNAWWQTLETVPTISSLRDKVESIREQELEKALSRLGSEFAEKHQEVIEALTRGIVNKILHDPMVQLRAQQDIEMRRQAIETLRLLFNLDAEAISQG
ncbi:glutamyl-tRNA reductase [Trichothermofontia sp.]